MTNLSPAVSGTLIPVFDGILNDESQPLVDARELHRFLEVRRDFSTWIKDRIKDYGFAQGIDFIDSPVLVNRGFWKTNITEYHLSLDMAKELAMVERSDKGREVRRYFIAIERAVREQEIPAITRKAKKEVERLTDLVDELQDAYCRAHPDTVRLLRYRSMGLTRAEIAKLTDCHPATVGRALKKLETLGFIAASKQLSLQGV